VTNWRALVAIGLASGLAACGARVDHGLRDQVVKASLAQGARAGSGTGAGAGSDANSSTDDTTLAGSGIASGGGSGLSAAAGGGAASASGAVGSPAPAQGNGGATDVGVTATSITVGNVADLSGPVPGLFQAAPYGAEAYFAYVNSNGGVFGRQLKLTGADGQTDCTANQNAHINLLPRVFAFVGSFSLYDDCGTEVLKQHPDVSDLSYALGAETKNNTQTNFPPQVAPLGYQSGPFCYWASKYPDAVKKVGSIYPNIPAAATSEKMIENAAKSCGWQWVDSIPVGATDTTFDAEINKICSDKAQVMFLIASTAQNSAKMKQEADAQNCKMLWIVPIAYASDFIQRLGSAAEAEGIVGHNLYSMFFSSDDAKNIPEVALFQRWMHLTHPGAALELYAMYSWAAAKLFVQVLQQVGPKLTRPAFLSAIRQVHQYDGGGIVAGSELAKRQPPNCYLLWQIHNGTYTRLDTPADSYRCDGTFVPYNP